MKRNFTLEDISFDEYNAICRELGLPIDHSPFSTNKRHMCGYPKRYTKLKEKITYNNLSEIIEGIEDEYTITNRQRIHMVYTKPLLLSFSITKKCLKENPANYLERLQEFEEVLGRMEFTLKKGKNENVFYSDSFTFMKEDNLWVLRKVVVHRPNYCFYTFDGLQGTYLDKCYSLQCVLPK
ncbi:hypothetical protein HY636_00825 [Candidatus Woesearchaeota archaeon]|nr:hypothetical protein [Candidatus Woesearchaeota archaeon]